MAVHDARPLIVVTAFGPFGCHDRNPSQDISSLLQASRDELEASTGARFEFIDLRVEYKAVDEAIGKIWTELKPAVVVMSRSISTCFHEKNFSLFYTLD